MADNATFDSQTNQKLIDKFKNDLNLILENIPQNILLKLGTDSVSWFESFHKDMVSEVNNPKITTLIEEQHSEEDLEAEKENTASDLTGKNQLSDNEYENLKEKLSSLREEFNECLQESKDKDNTIKKLKKQLKEKTSGKDEEVENYEKEIEKLEDENKKLKSENKNFSRELTSMKEDLSDLQKKVEAKETLIKSLKNELRGSVSEEEKTKYEKEIEELKRTCSDHNKERNTLFTECEDLKKAAELTLRKVKKHEAELLIQSSKIEQLESKLEISEKNLKEKEEFLQKKKQALTIMKSKIKTSLDQSTDNKEIENELYNTKMEIEQMKLKLENYQECLDKKFSECDLQKKYIETCKEEIKSLKLQINNENFQQRDSEIQPLQAAFQISTNVVSEEQPQEKKYNYPDWWQLHMSKKRFIDT